MEQYLDRIKQINPLSTMGSQQLEELSKTGEFLELKNGHVLFKMGDNDAAAYYLMDGEMEISGDSDRVRKIDLESDNGRYAIGNLQPRPFTAKITSKTAVVLKCSRDSVEKLVARRQMVTGEVQAVTVSDMAEPEGVDGAWMFQMIQSDIFRDLPTENIERFFSAVERVEHKAGEIIVTQGEIGHRPCILLHVIFVLAFSLLKLIKKPLNILRTIQMCIREGNLRDSDCTRAVAE